MLSLDSMDDFIIAPAISFWMWMGTFPIGFLFPTGGFCQASVLVRRVCCSLLTVAESASKRQSASQSASNMEALPLPLEGSDASSASMR
jgi:hypothetical protein